MNAKPAPGTRKLAQRARTASRRLARLRAKPRRGLKRGHVLNRVGAVTRRYMLVRDAFLRDRHARGVIECDFCGRHGVMVETATGPAVPGFHVHHVQKRSLHPELRGTAGNLVLFCQPCHVRAHAQVVS